MKYKHCEAAANLELGGDPQKDDLINLLRKTGFAASTSSAPSSTTRTSSPTAATISKINENTLAAAVQQARKICRRI